MKIAIIGSGISGLTCAHYLNQHHDVTLFESHSYLGGHTNTVSVELDGKEYCIDTGFIVFNKQTYPAFTQLLQELNVDIEKTEMSFSFRSDTFNLEYNPTTLNGLFACRKNLLNPVFYKMLVDILRFHKHAKKVIKQQNTLTPLKEYLAQHRYSKLFLEAYLLPICAAIWSTDPNAVLEYPVEFLFVFFQNHGLLQCTNQPQWYIIKNGSHTYVSKIAKNLKNNYLTNTPVKKIIRHETHCSVVTHEKEMVFDKIVFACHSQQALNLLEAPSDNEQEILSSIKFKSNKVVLHTDSSVLPKKKEAWASWNYLVTNEQGPSLSYYMNKLQVLEAPYDICVSVNLKREIKTDKILQCFEYEHPQFTTQAITAQKRLDEINGKNNTFYCGAYWGYGFHEDGVSSAKKVVRNLGLEI